MANNVSYDLTGSDDLIAALKKLGTAALPAAAGSLYRSAEKVMATSKDTYVPYDTGALMNTGHVELPETTDQEVLVKLGYGGPSVDYAIWVHERDLHYHHGRSWKYLEIPLNAALADIDQALLDDLNAGFSNL